MNKNILAVGLSAVVALTLAVAPAASFAKSHSKKVDCYGIDTCKGKKDCKEDKMKAVKKTAKQCKKMGGSTEKPAE